jgi:pilus assembly protein CpaB
VKSRLIGGIASLLLAIIGTTLLVLYVNGAEARAQEGLDPVNVLVVKEAIPAGSPVAEISAMLETKAVAKAAVPAGTLDSLAGQEGKITAVDLLPGEQLLEARLVSPEDFDPGTVPVPDGMEEVTILLAPERMLGGRLKAGDMVGLYISAEFTDETTPETSDIPDEMVGWKQFTNQRFQNVLITAVQQAAPETEDSADADGVAMPNGSAFVTVARTDLDTAEIVFGAEFGRIWLSKESSKSEVVDTPVVIVPEVLK